MERKLLRSVSYLIMFSIISKLIGFFREFIIAYKFGASSIADAYFTAITISVTFFGGLILAFNTSIIPIYSKICVNEPNKKFKYLNALQTLLYLVQIGLIIVFFVSIRTVVKIFFGGLSDVNKELMISLSSIMIFATLFTAKRSVIDGYLQYHNKVHLTFFCGNILSNIIVIIFICISTPEKCFLIAIGHVIAAFVVSMILSYYAKKELYTYKVNFDFNTPEIKESVYFVLPIFINTSLMAINTFIDRSIASNVGDGVISSLAYGYKLNDIFIATFASTLAAALYPQISKLIASNNMNETSEMIMSSFKYILILMLPISFILFFYSYDITHFLLERGAFSKDNTIMTANCLKYYSIGMVFFAFRQILYKVMLSFRLTKEVMYNSIFVVILNIVLDLVLVKVWGYKGVAFATSITIAWTTIYMITILKRNGVKFSILNSLQDIIRILICSLTTIGLGYVVYNSINLYVNLASIKFMMLVIIILASIGIYILLLMICNISEVKEIKRIIQRKLKL